MFKIKRRSRFKRLLLRYYKQFIIEQRISNDGVSRFWIMRKLSLTAYECVFGPYRSLKGAERDLQKIIRRVLSIKVHRRNARTSRTKINL